MLDGWTVDLGERCWDPLRALGRCEIQPRTPPELVGERAGKADVILTSKVKLDAATLRALPRFRFVSAMATGFDNVDVTAAGALGVPVSNIPGYAAPSVAQTALGLILELAIGSGSHDRAVMTGEWSSWPDHSMWKQPMVELDGRALGIVGYGANGRAVARIGAALGRLLLACTPRLPDRRAPARILECPLRIGRCPQSPITADGDRHFGPRQAI